MEPVLQVVLIHSLTAWENETQVSFVGVDGRQNVKQVVGSYTQTNVT